MLFPSLDISVHRLSGTLIIQQTLIFLGRFWKAMWTISLFQSCQLLCTMSINIVNLTIVWAQCLFPRIIPCQYRHFMTSIGVFNELPQFSLACPQKCFRLVNHLDIAKLFGSSQTVLSGSNSPFPGPLLLNQFAILDGLFRVILRLMVNTYPRNKREQMVPAVNPLGPRWCSITVIER